MRDKLVVILMDEESEEKIRTKILKILNRKIKGIPNTLRQSDIHKQVGSGIKACYLKYILETMCEEEIIMMH